MLRRLLQLTMVAGCLGAISTLSAAADSAPFAAPAPIVYVSDFDLDVANVTPDSGPGQRVRRLRGLLPSGPGPMGKDKNPQDHAKDIVNEMGDALTADLKKGGDFVRLPVNNRSEIATLIREARRALAD